MWVSRARRVRLLLAACFAFFSPSFSLWLVSLSVRGLGGGVALMSTQSARATSSLRASVQEKDVSYKTAEAQRRAGKLRSEPTGRRFDSLWCICCLLLVCFGSSFFGLPCWCFLVVRLQFLFGLRFAFVSLSTTTPRGAPFWRVALVVF